MNKTNGKFKRTQKDERNKYSSKGKSKPNRNNSKSKSEETRDENFYASKNDFENCHTNDINWWNKVTSVYDQATRIPFAKILGDRYSAKDYIGGFGNSAYGVDYQIPGAMCIDYIPTIGDANSYTDAVNIAFDQIYSYMYTKYTAGINIQKVDIAFYCLLVSQIANFIGSAKRAIRTLYSYAPANHNFPKLIWKAIGMDPNNFDSDVALLATYKEKLNTQIRYFNTTFCPNFIDLFARWYSLSTNVWLDDATIDSQAYVFKAVGQYEYMEAQGTDPAKLHLTLIPYGDNTSTNPSAIYNIAGILDTIDNMMASLRQASFYNLVNGAMLKAFSEHQVLRVDELKDVEILEPAFDPIIMKQIQNAVIYDFGLTSQSSYLAELDIVDDTLNNLIKCEPYIHASQRLGYIKGYFLNEFDGDTSAAAIMESTRLMPAPATNRYTLNAFLNGQRLYTGTEIPIYMSIYFNDVVASSVSQHTSYIQDIKNLTSLTQITYTSTGDITPDTIYSAPYQMMRALFAISKFRVHPTIYWSELGTVPDQTATVSNPVFAGIIGDVYKQTMISFEDLQGLHTAALLSIYSATLPK